MERSLSVLICNGIGFVLIVIQTREWESAVRSTRPKESLVDAVGVIAILEKSSGPELLLQKQYRPPIDKISIEVPAGLVDQGESPKEAALRELKEETGYVGEVIEGHLGLTPTFFNGSCLCFAFHYVKVVLANHSIVRSWIHKHEYKHGAREN